MKTCYKLANEQGREFEVVQCEDGRYKIITHYPYYISEASVCENCGYWWEPEPFETESTAIEFLKENIEKLI